MKDSHRRVTFHRKEKEVWVSWMWILRLEGIDIICRWVRRQRGREDTTSESVMHGGCVRSEVLKGGITLVLTSVPTAVISTYWMMCGELGFINNSWFVSSPEPERRASLRHEPIKTTVQSPRGPPERLQTSYIQIIQYRVLFLKAKSLLLNIIFVLFSSVFTCHTCFYSTCTE